MLYYFQGYLARYATASQIGHQPNCEVYARIHNGGLQGYLQKPHLTNGYWAKMKTWGCNANS